MWGLMQHLPSRSFVDGVDGGGFGSFGGTARVCNTSANATGRWPMSSRIKLKPGVVRNTVQVAMQKKCVKQKNVQF